MGELQRRQEASEEKKVAPKRAPTLAGIRISIDPIGHLAIKASKYISLDVEAYERLKAKKRPGETFSDVVKRELGRRRPLGDFVGMWKEMPDEELEEVKATIREGRRLDLERQNRLLER